MTLAETPIRTFIAIELPPDLKAAIRDAQAALKQWLPFSALRWATPDGIHLTLKFLGDVQPGRLAAIQAGLAAVAPRHLPFDLTVGGLGVFPNPARPNVLWIGLGGDLPRLRALRDAVEAAIAPLGYPTESRPFHPHLTLARIKDARTEDVQRLRDVLRQPPPTELGALPVAAVSLMRSDLSPRGARYAALGVYRLAGTSEV